MIGLVLVTHGRLAAEFLAAMEHVVGAQPSVEAICIAADDDMEVRRADIAAAVARCNTGNGVIILTDMFGGTPSNLAISLLGSQVEVIAGVNLPMRRMPAANISPWPAACWARWLERDANRRPGAGADHQSARAARAGQRQVRYPGLGIRCRSDGGP
jgi:mannose PTS system EIIA component